MIKKLSTKLLAAMALSFSASSFAGLITDVVEQEEYVTSSSCGLFCVEKGVHSYTHNLLEPGDDPFTLGSALSGSLSINIFDDSNDGFRNYKGEGAVIVVENFDFDTGGTWGALLGSATPGWAADLEVEALLALNTNGMLDVTIKGLGDFWVGDSTLTIETADVPEPGSIALLGLGLAGLGFARRKQKA